jgi:hypothetical protein
LHFQHLAEQVETAFSLLSRSPTPSPCIETIAFLATLDTVQRYEESLRGGVIALALQSW